MPDGTKLFLSLALQIYSPAQQEIYFNFPLFSVVVAFLDLTTKYLPGEKLALKSVFSQNTTRPNTCFYFSGPKFLRKHFDELKDSIDFFSVMTYDYHSQAWVCLPTWPVQKILSRKCLNLKEAKHCDLRIESLLVGLKGRKDWNSWDDGSRYCSIIYGGTLVDCRAVRKCFIIARLVVVFLCCIAHQCFHRQDNELNDDLISGELRLLSALSSGWEDR